MVALTEPVPGASIVLRSKVTVTPGGRFSVNIRMAELKSRVGLCVEVIVTCADSPGAREMKLGSALRLKPWKFAAEGTSPNETAAFSSIEALPLLMMSSHLIAAPLSMHAL